VVFAQTLFTRAVDPVIPQIAADLAVGVQTAALLSTAFTFPYALVQPALGVAGDFFGKTRLMNICVLVVAISSLICAFADSFALLVAMRILAGLSPAACFRSAWHWSAISCRSISGRSRSRASSASRSPPTCSAPRSPA